MEERGELAGLCLGSFLYLPELPIVPWFSQLLASQEMEQGETGPEKWLPWFREQARWASRPWR